ncbi:MAG TPA: hypothetical protein VGG69_05795 [Rhizomicrobium sp.]
MQSGTARHRNLVCFAAFAAITMLSAAPARADFCMQLNGGSFSGDLGFFRFQGRLPTAPGAMVALHGRAAGLDPVFGAATVPTDGSYVELGATFFIDATEGQFDVTFFPPGAKNGSGYADYGTYDVNQSVTAKIVHCGLEPVRAAHALLRKPR